MSNSSMNVNLNFTADTSNAVSAMKKLQSELSNLLGNESLSSKNFGITKEITKASEAAALLKVQLKEATNIHTGKLDLGRFTESMKANNMTLKEYQTQLSRMGPSGNQAFASLAKAISAAEIPMKRTSEWANNMYTSLKNTAKWQLSSSLLHGFMGSVQQAYGYAKDLNRSLNDIRIVTGQSTSQMAKFAVAANKSAKDLSANTTAYTKASLIYYQQGLSDQEVKKRTDTTIKMANATGTSAEKVSDQMTAVWNNFAKDSTNLEHYADVMTALGAATASSTDEIATGLSKFAAIGDMIGLSYEYAASALATVTATTRQSAEIVGTAFKTIFARIQGLKLGKTLEDGTDLNKYSEALQSVGISIKDRSGELKDMNAILEEMGSKWKTLSKDQQVALGQTVAGTRQYNQLVALMDNWDYFQQNLNVANTSDGTLQKQADIYAESWDAASKRVKASAEGVYSSILKDDFFINFNNFIATLLSGVQRLVEEMGGFKGILLTIGSIASTVFQKQLLKNIDNLKYSLRMNFGKGSELAEEQRKEANELLMKQTAQTIPGEAGKDQVEIYRIQGELQQSLINNAHHMSEAQKEVASVMLEQQEILGQKVMLAHEEQNILEKETAQERKRILLRTGKNSGIASKFDNYTSASQKYGFLNNLFDKITSANKNGTFDENSVKSFQEAMKGREDYFKAVFDPHTKVVKDWNNFSNNATTDNLRQLAQDFFGNNLNKLATLQGKLVEELVKTNKFNQDEAQAVAEKVARTSESSGTKESEHVIGMVQSREGSQQLKGDMDKAVFPVSGMETFTNVAALAMSATVAMRGLKVAIQAVTAEGATFGERMSSAFLGISMSASALARVVTNNKLMQFLTKFGSDGFFGAGKKAAAASATAAAETQGVGKLAALFGGLKGLALTLIASGIFALGGKIAQDIKDNSIEGQLKQAEEVSAQLSKQLSNIQEKANTTKDAFSKYYELTNILKGCAAGTEEWNNNLQKVNASVQTLLTQFPELATLVNKNGDKALIDEGEGNYSIANWAENAISEKNKKIEQTIKGAQKDNLLQINQLQFEKENEILAKEKGDLFFRTNSLTTKIIRNKAIAKQIFPNASDVLQMDDAQLRKFLDNTAISSYKEGSLDLIIDSILNNAETRKVLTDVAQKQENLQKNKEIQNKIQTSDLLKNNDKVEISDEKDNIINTLAAQREKMYDNAKEAIKDTDTEDLFKDYASSIGQNAAQFIDSEGKGSKELITYIDDQGQRQEVYASVMRDLIASSQTNTELLEQADKLAPTYSRISEQSPALVSALTALSTGDNTYAPIGLDSIKDNIEVLKLTDEELQTLGYDNVDALITALQETLDQSQANWKNNIETYSDTVKNALSSFVPSSEGEGNSLLSDNILSQLNQRDLEGYGDALGNIEMTSGAQVAKNVHSKFLGVLESVEPEFASKLMSIFNNTDWNGENAILEFQEALAEARIGIDETGDTWKDFSSSVSQVELIIDKKGLKETREELSALAKAAANVRVGKIISDEEYQKIIKANHALKEMFTQTASGYRFLGNQEDIDNLINHQIDKNLENSSTIAETAEKAYGAASAYREETNDAVLVGKENIVSLDLLASGTATGEEYQEGIANLLASNDSAAILEQLGINNEALQEKAERVISDDKTIQDAVRKDLSVVFSDLLSFMNQYENGNFDEQSIAEVNAASYTSLDALKSSADTGKISSKIAEEASESVFAAEGESLGFKYEDLVAYRDTLIGLNESLEDHLIVLDQTTISSMRFDRATKDLEKNWKNMNKVLLDSNSSTSDKIAIFTQIRQIIEDFLNLKPEKLSKGFASSADNLELMGKIAEGDAQAFNDLQAAAAKDIFLGQVDENNLQFKGQIDSILSQISEISNLEGFDIGDMITVGTGPYDDLVSLYNSMMSVLTGMGKDADSAISIVNDAFSSMGLTTPEVTTEEIPVEGTTPGGWQAVPTSPVATTDPDGQMITVRGANAKALEGEEINSTIKVPKFIPKGGGFVKTAEPSGTTGKHGGGGGGGGGKPKKIKKTKADAKSRYHHVNEQIKDKERSASNYQKIADQLYGKDRIANMQAENKELEKSIKLYDKKAEEAKKYLEIDRKAAEEAAKELNQEIQYDAEGNIVNYEEILAAGLKRLNDAEDHFNSLGAGAQQEYQETLNDEKEKFKELQEKLNQYEETDALIEEIEDKRTDILREIQENNYAVLEYKLELGLDLKEADLKQIEYYLNKTADDAFLAGEQFFYLTEKLRNTTESLEMYKAHLESLNTAYEDGKISEADYAKGLKDTHNEILEHLSSIDELDKQMKAYYGETLEKANEELDKYTSKMDGLTQTLEHYQNILNVLGKETDYQSIGVILEGKSKNLKSELDYLKKNYESLNASKEEMYQKLQGATDPKEIELLKQQYSDIEDVTIEAYNNMLEKAEEYGESLKSILENALSQAAKELENLLTGNSSFDQTMKELEHLSAEQEEYLTETNKLYETNKLIRQAQQDIDKTTNEAEKKRLQDFINQTNELQKQGTLSQFELEIQQKKYEILLAEQALEDAKMAKSKVRLTRDNEGGFSYTYTADSDAMSDAEQELADKENDLYNLLLQGSYDYTDKYMQTYKEMYDALKQLEEDHMNGAFESEEEYQNAKTELINHYNKMLYSYQELYQISIKELGDKAVDSWTLDFEEMQKTAGHWNESVNGYLSDCEKHFADWQTSMKDITDLAGKDLDTIQKDTSNITNEHNKLATEVKNNVIPQLEQERKTVETLTEAFGKQRKELEQITNSYGQMAESIEQTLRKQQELNKEQFQSKDLNDSTSNVIISSKTPTRQTEVSNNKKGPGLYPDWFDTGGYTGEWGSEGKWAILHQKELVLNAHDTKNFLQALELTRSFVNVIETQAMQMQHGLAALLNPGFISKSDETLQQEVTIHAEFPNVSDHNEIEEAFDTLVNQASQYANRK